MTVKELIAELSGMPPAREVAVNAGGSFFDVVSVRRGFDSENEPVIVLEVADFEPVYVVSQQVDSE